MRLGDLERRNTQVYISGPITEIEDLNELAFNRAKKTISDVGLYPISPLDIKPHPASNHPYGKYMRAVVKAQMDCDAVYMLTGWEQSVGARIEHQLAAVCGMPIIYEEK